MVQKNQDQKHIHTNPFIQFDNAIMFSLLVLDPEWKWIKPYKQIYKNEKEREYTSSIQWAPNKIEIVCE